MADLDALFDQAHSSSGPTDLGRITPANNQLDDVFDSVHGNTNQASAIGSYVGEGIKQFGAGSVEGTGGFLGFLSDINPASVPEKLSGMITDAVTGENQDLGIFDRMFSNSKQIKGITDSILPKTDNGYSRMVGNFVGPQILMGLAGKAAAIPALAEQMGARALTSATSAGVAARGAEDMFPNNPVVPLIASILGGLAPGAAVDSVRGLKSMFIGASPAEIRGSAATALNEFTGLTPQQIAAARAAAPADDLGRMMTTAEVTDNAGMAQIEKQLAGQGQRANQYAAANNARSDLREGAMQSMAPAPAMTGEGRGAMLMDTADDVATRNSGANRQRWGQFDREVPLDVSDAQVELAPLFPDPAAGRNLNAEVDNLATQVMEAPNGNLTSGQWQTIRSQSLELLRDKTLHNADRRMLSAIAGQADDAARAGLPPDQYELWRAARQGTARQAQRFAKGTAGGTLTDPKTRAVDAFDRALKGDRQSAIELRDAVANDPAAMGQVARGLIERVGRDASGNLTPAKFNAFLEQNAGAIREVLGPDHHYALQRIGEDLVSQSRVQQNANLASKGQSATQQRMTVAGALSDTMEKATLRSASPWASRLWTLMREGAGLKDQAQIQEMLFRAAMEPAFAQQLAAAPTAQRVMQLGERLTTMFKTAVKEGGREGVIDLTRPDAAMGEPEPTPTPKKKTDILGSLSDFIVPEAQAETPEETMPLTDQPVNLPKILNAIKHVESRGKTDATSSVGAKGQYQLMDATGREWHKKLGIKEAYNPRDPAQSRKIAGAYVKFLIDYYDGDVTKAVTAYHTGIGNVDKNKIGPRGKEYAGLVEKAYDKL